MNKYLVLFCGLITAFNIMAWDTINDPNHFDTNYINKLDQLPSSGELSLAKTPWSSSFWPHIYGGIAFRWHDYYLETPSFASKHNKEGKLKDRIKELKKEIFSKINPSSDEIRTSSLEINRLKSEIIANNNSKAREYDKYFFSVKRITKKEALNMSQSELMRLSPAEKYDLYQDNYSLKLTDKVLRMTSPNSQYWEGICNGWSSASLEFYEPQAQVVINEAGIAIPFGSSDLKALLSYYHVSITKNLFARKDVIKSYVGKRCGVEFPKEAWVLKNGKEYYKDVVYDRRSNSYEIQTFELPPECIDTNPGAFHIIMANQLAFLDQGFNAEMVRDMEVWNQPVFKYETETVGEVTPLTSNRTENTVRQVQVKTRLYYANDGGRIFWGAEDPEDEFYAWWDKTTGTSNYRFAHKDLEYILDLDHAGSIIGGQWISYERPDFLWIKKNKGFVNAGGIVGYLKGLRDLVQIR